MTARIFINYRRGESSSAAGRLHDCLRHHFDRTQLFMDVDSIAPGVDFVKALDEQVARCQEFIAVIGPDWLEVRNPDGGRRLDDPDDYVRIEIEAALNRGIRVIPVLVDGAKMPRAKDLPPAIRKLSRRQAHEISHTRFIVDVQSLARAIMGSERLGVRSTSHTLPGLSRPAFDNPDSWAEILFGFRGRISRKTYWKGVLAVNSVLFFISILATFLVLMVILDASSDVSQSLKQFGEISQSDWRFKYFSTLISLPFYWPFFSLMLKRLHDFNQSGRILFIYAIVNGVTLVLWLAGHDYLFQSINAVGLTVMIFLGIVRGTVGDNSFGPDPLSNSQSSRKSKSQKRKNGIIGKYFQKSHAISDAPKVHAFHSETVIPNGRLQPSPENVVSVETIVEWYLFRDGKQHGPISNQELMLIARQGHLKNNDFIWRQGFDEWVRVDQFRLSA